MDANIFPKLEDLTKFQEFVIRAKYPEFHKYLCENFPHDLSWKEKLYWYYHSLTAHPVCKYCGSDKVNFISIPAGYKTYCCCKCAANDEESKRRRANTNIEKYGCTTPLQSEEIKSKIKQTCLEKYGVENPRQNEDVKNKAILTCITKYGVRNPFASEEIKSKIKQTCLEKYGVENPQQNEDVKNKSRQTCLSRWGVDNASKNDIIKHIKNDSRVETFKKEYKSAISYLGNNTWTIACPHPECNKCTEKYFESPWSIYKDRLRLKIEPCTRIFPIQAIQTAGTSIELFVRNILDEHSIEYECNNRTILNGKEIDIYIPSKKIGIECNGIYWHSSYDKLYHIHKYELCAAAGVQLLTIWEDQIKTKPHIVESIILSKLGIYERRIYARKCEVRVVPGHDVVEFLNDNHMQGNTNASIKIGLYYDDELVSLMTFGKSSRLSGHYKDRWCLTRFCSKRNTQVIGAAGRLLNWFIKNYNPSLIESFASNDISNGGLYDKLGFKKSDNITSAYWYVNRFTFTRYHRTSFTKSKLKEMGYDVDGKTEFDIMKSLSFFKIYDAGHTKYTLYVNN